MISPSFKELAFMTSEKNITRSDRLQESYIIFEILKRIPVSTRLISAGEIVRSLEEAGINISRRTAQRYLKRLVEESEYGVIRDTRDRTYGYRRERSSTIFDEVKLKANECLLLRLAQEHMRYQMPGAVLKSLDFLFEEAEKMLNEKDPESKENRWLQKVCVVSPTIPQLPAKILPRIFETVSDALYKEVKLRVVYTNSLGRTTESLVSPLGLVQQDVRLYLVCKFDDFENVVHLAIHRFQEAEVTSFEISRPKDFNLREYVNQRHFNYSNGDWVRWIVEFKSSTTALNLRETPFNESQKLEKLPNGTWRLEVEIQDSPLLDGWIATWQKEAEIISSQRLPLSIG